MNYDWRDEMKLYIIEQLMDYDYYLPIGYFLHETMAKHELEKVIKLHIYANFRINEVELNEEMK